MFLYNFHLSYEIFFNHLFSNTRQRKTAGWKVYTDDERLLMFFMKIIQFFLFAEIFNIHHRNFKLIRWSSHSR